MTTSKKSNTPVTAAAAAPTAPFAPSTASSSLSSVSLMPGASPALFTAEVTEMDRQELNRLDMNALPRWARFVVEKERRRRKNQEQKPSKTSITATVAATTLATAAAPTKMIATTTTSASTPSTATTTAALSAATRAVTAATAKPSFKLKLPAIQTDSALEELKDKLPKMDRKDLNLIDLKVTPSWARSLVTEERCKRKKMDATVESVTASLAISATASKAVEATTAIAKKSATTNAEAAIATKKEVATTDAPVPAVPAAGAEAVAVAVAVVAAVATTSKATFKLKLPATQSNTALTELKSKLLNMDRKDLNLINMQTTPSWARPPINNERCRRKKLDPSTESQQTLTVVPSSATATTARAITATTRASAATTRTSAATTRASSAITRASSTTTRASATTTRASTTAASSSSSSTYMALNSSSNSIPRRRVAVEQPNSSQWSGRQTTGTTGTLRRSMVRSETAETADGGFLNEELVKEAAKKTSLMWDCEIIYDSNLPCLDFSNSDIKDNSRDMFGRFKCTTTNCKYRSRKWHSAEIFTRFWYRRTLGSVRPGMRDTFRYRSLIYWQKCRGCETFMEANLDHESYVKTAIKAFALWTNRRDREYRDSDSDSEKFTRPHDTKRCGGCINGLHHATPQATYSHINSYQWRY